MAAGSVIYWREVRALRRAGVDLHARFATLATRIVDLPIAANGSLSRPTSRSRACSPDCGRSPTWSATADRSIPIAPPRAMRPYVDAGLTTFDMADHYGSAELIAGDYRRAGAAAHPCSC